MFVCLCVTVWMRAYAHTHRRTIHCSIKFDMKQSATGQNSTRNKITANKTRAPSTAQKKRFSRIVFFFVSFWLMLLVFRLSQTFCKTSATLPPMRWRRRRGRTAALHRRRRHCSRNSAYWGPSASLYGLLRCVNRTNWFDRNFFLLHHHHQMHEISFVQRQQKSKTINNAHWRTSFCGAIRYVIWQMDWYWMCVARAQKLIGQGKQTPNWCTAKKNNLTSGLMTWHRNN